MSANDEKFVVGRLDNYFLALPDCAIDDDWVMQCHGFPLFDLLTSANPSASGDISYIGSSARFSVFTLSDLRARPAVVFVSGRLEPALAW